MTDLFIPGRPGGHITYKTNRKKEAIRQVLPSIRPTALPSTNQSNHIADHTQWPASLTASFSTAVRAPSARSSYNTQQHLPEPPSLFSDPRIRAQFQTTRQADDAENRQQATTYTQHPPRDTRCHASAPANQGDLASRYF